MLYPLKSRIVKYLCDLTRIEKSNCLRLNMTQTAEYFGVTPRHLRRIMAELEEKKLICRSPSRIEIIDIKALEKLVAPSE
jgi:DNA-binding IscR family transcriptional regulator